MGSMVLAWDAVKSGAADPSDGKNVVLHEFAHQLDYENFAADGTPALATRKHQLAWREVMRTEFASLRAAEATGIPTLLDTYGATNAAEFFAVSTEAFFERPVMLRVATSETLRGVAELFSTGSGRIFGGTKCERANSPRGACKCQSDSDA